MTEGSGWSVLNILLVILRLGVAVNWAVSGGVVPNVGVPIEPGDLRDGAFNGSAEC
jgi:hypothetical protein